MKHLRYLNKSQYLDPIVVKKHQWQMVQNLLKHAYENSKFYRNQWDEKGIHPDDIRTEADYLRIPLLTKDQVRKQAEELYAPNYQKFYRFLTSGSTGVPIEGYRDRECHSVKRAVGAWSTMLSGWQLGERVYVLYGDPKEKLGWKKKLRRRLLTRDRRLDTLNISEEAMMSFVQTMRKKPPSLIWGHTHNMYLFARFLEKQGIDDIRPKGLISAGMPMHSWEREQVEKVFRCKFLDRYGCEEFGVIAVECLAQEGLHVTMDGLYVELLDEHGMPVEPGQRGQIVVTDLTNYCMPFIRYEMGDIGVRSGRKCSCGRTQPLLERIEGRTADFLVTPEGKMISGISLTDHFGASIPGVAQIQLIQESLDRLTIHIVKDPAFGDASVRAMDQLVRKFFGNMMKYECRFLSEIPKDPSGKYRFTICKVENPYYAR